MDKKETGEKMRREKEEAAEAAEKETGEKMKTQERSEDTRAK